MYLKIDKNIDDAALLEHSHSLIILLILIIKHKQSLSLEYKQQFILNFQLIHEMQSPNWN